MNDEFYMKRALELAAKGKGKTSPNPCVGCVIVKNDTIISEGRHEKAGEAHAEINALHNASEDVIGSTVYVTLEPCSHFGRTPPCVSALVDARVERVVVAMRDPFAKVDGKGISELKVSGIQVTVGVCENEARELNKEWVHFITTGLPFVYLKAAMTLDGKISRGDGKQEWITGKESLQAVHRLRDRVDAIIVGKNTVRIDNPRLNVRLEGKEEKFPLRVVLGSKDGLDENFHIFTQEGTTLFYDSHDLKKLLRSLADRNVVSVLIEGGANVYNQFVSAQLVDEYWLFVAPKTFGEGIDAFSCDIEKRLNHQRVEEYGEDILMIGSEK